MLRAIVSALAIAFAAFALVSVVQQPVSWPLLPVALLLVIGCVAERRYHRAGVAPGAGFHPTGERFVDPETGRAMTVWSDPATGERRYGVDGEAPISRR
jgi:hypothetical protein